MIAAFNKLHQNGHAHSIEIWHSNKLVGGIYGVATRNVFCGESMFSRISNASKIALSCLIRYIKPHGFKLIDCQVENPHLILLGAQNISRNEYIKVLSTGSFNTSRQIWTSRTLDWKKLLEVSDV